MRCELVRGEYLFDTILVVLASVAIASEIVKAIAYEKIILIVRSLYHALIF
ncbi:hypothetical protein [Nostoc sp. DSM 114159]|jgi:hypothetical protein